MRCTKEDPNVRDVDDDDIWRITSLLGGTIAICATLEVILIVLVLYFLVPPTGDYNNVCTHVNPRNNQCKPQRKNT